MCFGVSVFVFWCYRVASFYISGDVPFCIETLTADVERGGERGGGGLCGRMKDGGT